MASDHPTRIALERKASTLVGERLDGVRYADVYNFNLGPDTRTWDYGDWHSAVMGVELILSGGPVSILWTNTFFPFGVEVFREPISNHLVVGPDGPEIWEVGDHATWRDRVDASISAASLFWQRIEVGPTYRLSDGERLSEGKTVDVPVGLRLDFEAGPHTVWFVAAMPDLSVPDDPDKVFVLGDEIMVVFTADKMRRIGFSDDEFVRVIDQL